MFCSSVPACSFRLVASATSCSACPRRRRREPAAQLAAPRARAANCSRWACKCFWCCWPSATACSYSSRIALLMLSFASARRSERESAAASFCPSRRMELHWLCRSLARRFASKRSCSRSCWRMTWLLPSSFSLASVTVLDSTNCLMSCKALAAGSPGLSSSSISDFANCLMSCITLLCPVSGPPSEPSAGKRCQASSEPSVRWTGRPTDTPRTAAERCNRTLCCDED
mmetsp:Transcript_28514/g.84992  ORF Transcript_28514/g.84992 Transcript_28514/m.84992 type:complete len:228 (-) Transcript_28514:177-860(-)